MAEYLSLDLIEWPAKDPGEINDYSIDWTGLMPSDDTVLNTVWGPVEGLTFSNYVNEGVISRAMVSGGTDGQLYEVPAVATTAQGRTLRGTRYLPVVTRKD